VFDWPKDGKLNVPFSNKITKACLLADAKTNLKVTAAGLAEFISKYLGPQMEKQGVEIR
jgi:hypothetical protein